MLQGIPAFQLSKTGLYSPKGTVSIDENLPRNWYGLCSYRFAKY